MRNRLLFFASIALYAISLGLPAYRDGDGAVSGLFLLGFGWMSLIILSHVSWLANPVLFFAWFAGLSGTTTWPRRLAITSFVLMAIFFLQGTTPDANTGSHPIAGWLPGYFVWTLSPVPLFALVDSNRRLRSP